MRVTYLVFRDIAEKSNCHMTLPKIFIEVNELYIGFDAFGALLNLYVHHVQIVHFANGALLHWHTSQLGFFAKGAHFKLSGALDFF